MKAGDLVGPNVRLERLLSEGGMGSVWLAEHLTLRTQVAVKFMMAEMASDPGLLARFTREATAAAQIKSPHVVTISDHGVSPEGVPYIVMELLHGEDLDDRLRREGKLGLAETTKIVRDVAKALASAHKAGIVHRDIKPANLFLVDVEGDVFVKVLDFGIAKQTREIAQGVTHTGMLLGTPQFMSPEQVIEAKNVDYHADLWALAVVAYNCLTGQRPFRGESIGALSIAINNAVFLPPTLIVPELPRALDGFFAKALARDAAERFQSASELATAFTGAVPRDARSIRPPADVPRRPSGRPSHAPTVAARPAERAATVSASVPPSESPSTLGGASMASAARARRRRLTGLAAVGAVGVIGALSAGLLLSRTSRPQTPAAQPSTMNAAPPSAMSPAAPPSASGVTDSASLPGAPPAPSAATSVANPDITPPGSQTSVPARPAAAPPRPPPPARPPTPPASPVPTPAPPAPAPAPTVKDRGF
jgi:serine/threonine-protein kinase